MWRIRTNQEFRKLYKDLDIVTDIRKKEIQMNCTCSKDERRSVKKISESKLEGSRRK
jgi:hypothetical protein